ncbi:MAG: sterol desaturase family protein [Deltaproteobacteria bacterium]|nr:sterol desaturase family protein [Deltaproteobacteria bacterium]
MFDNALLERLSRIHPSTPFIAWVPVVAYMFYRSAHRGALTTLEILGWAAVGWLVWSFIEYMLHRFLFHAFENDPKRARIHFLLHGVHHDYPNDKDRLVMPLLVNQPVGWAVCLATFSLLGAVRAEPLFAGFALGYLGYDGMHYALHAFNPKSRVFKWMKHHHMRHHFMDHAGGFGVSSPLWDILFGTMPKPKKPVSR